MARTNCADCNAKLPPPRPGHPRTYCESCSPQRRKSKEPVLVAVDPVEPGRVEIATRAELDAAGHSDTVLGMVALTLAERMDAKADTGSSMAALAKALRETLEAINRNNNVQTLVDQLRARRDRKRGLPYERR